MTAQKPRWRVKQRDGVWWAIPPDGDGLRGFETQTAAIEHAQTEQRNQLQQLAKDHPRAALLALLVAGGLKAAQKKAQQ